MTSTQNTSAPRRRRKSAALLTGAGLLATGAIVLASFGVGGGKSMGSMNMAHGGASASTAVATTSVAIKSFAFSPATITVSAGSTVVWTNDDATQHDITFDGGSIKSSVLGHSDTFSHTFPTAGTYHYICSIHPFMHGTVIVTGSGSQHAHANTPAPASSGY